MKTFTLPAYDQENDPEAAAPGVWIFLWNAINQYPAGTAEQTKNGGDIIRAFEAAAVVEYNDKKQPVKKFLNPAGADIHLEDAAFTMLVKAADDYRTGKNGGRPIPLSSYRTLELWDSLAENAESYRAGEKPGPKLVEEPEAETPEKEPEEQETPAGV